jgi:NADH dehydrogenase FAD-containing subunit
MQAVVDWHGTRVPDGSLSGFVAWCIWRSAYWTRTVSLANKLLIPMYWFKTWAFGRDVTTF